MSRVSIDLNQIIMEADEFLNDRARRMPDEYILRGVAVTDEGDFEIDKHSILLFINKKTDQLTDKEKDILDDLFEKLHDTKYMVEINIIYDMDRIKSDITKYVDDLIVEIFG